MRRLINRKGDFAINQMMVLFLLIVIVAILVMIYGGIGEKIVESVNKIIASADKFSQGVS